MKKIILITFLFVVSGPTYSFMANIGFWKKKKVSYLSCQDAKDKGVSADGVVALDPDGAGANPSFNVFCKNMASGTPAEYLELINTSSASSPVYNYSSFACGGPCSGTPMYYAFTKLRINPTTLIIDGYDYTYTTQSGTSSYGGNGYGLAGDCAAMYSQTGTANINLIGTSFAIDDSVYFTNGNNGVQSYAGAGSVSFNADRTTSQITGGGYCGNYYPTTAATYPNVTLKLKFR